MTVMSAKPSPCGAETIVAVRTWVRHSAACREAAGRHPHEGRRSASASPQLDEPPPTATRLDDVDMRNPCAARAGR